MGSRAMYSQLLLCILELILFLRCFIARASFILVVLMRVAAILTDGPPR